MAVSAKWFWRQIGKFVLGRRRTTRFDDRLRRLERRVVRTEQALSLNLVERRLGGTQDLSRALKQVVTMAHDLTSARSCEIALYTLNTGTYHTALLVGAPTHASAQAMLSEAAGDNPLQVGDQTLVQPVIFAGETLGSLRLSFDRNQEISAEDRDVARLLAVQAGVAILNSRHAEQLGRISREADESLQAKLGFLANLSHEIRAPLGIMINGVEIA
jgi:GAF domain-containing protein